MDSGLYAACTALIARTQQLELAANNLANINTSGYRSQQITFHSALQGAGDSLDPLNSAVNDFAVLGGNRIDTSQGNIEKTGGEFDFALQGPGFFAVQTNAGVVYTRNGHFQLSPQRQLMTPDGDAVLGEQGPLRVPQGDVSVAADGTISVDGAVAGKLRVVEFLPGTQLAAQGKTYYTAAASAARPATAPSVRQGALEGSNVDAVTSAVGLIAIQRHAELLQRTLGMFHTELNRTAVEDLPRVS